MADAGHPGRSRLQTLRSPPITGDMTSSRRAFASRNCVISGANLCELVRTRRESMANLRKNLSRIRANVASRTSAQCHSAVSRSFFALDVAARLARTLTASAARTSAQVPLGGSVGGSVSVHSPLQFAPHEQVHRRESNIRPPSLGGFSFVLLEIR